MLNVFLTVAGLVVFAIILSVLGDPDVVLTPIARWWNQRQSMKIAEMEHRHRIELLMAKKNSPQNETETDSED